MTEKASKKTEILGVVQAQAETLENLSERLVKLETLEGRFNKLEKANERQESRNQHIVVAVLIAAFFVIFTIAAEVLLSNKHEDSIIGSFYEKTADIQQNISDLSNQIDLLRAKNPYLR